MPQPRTRGRRADDDSVLRGLTAVRELLGRGIILTSERLQETLDDAVRRGRMTRADAEELVQGLVAIGRRQAEEALTDLEALVLRPRDAAAGVGRRARDGAAQGTERVRREMGRARRAGGSGSSGTSSSRSSSTSSASSRSGGAGRAPIAGYDKLSAADVAKRLGGLTPAQVRKVRDYERAHDGRKTVLQAAERKLR